MIKKFLPRLIVIGLLIGLVFIPSISAKTAISNIKEYMSLRKTVKTSNNKLDELNSSISVSRKNLQEARGTKAVDLENSKALFDAIKNLPGVSGISGQIISIKGNTIKSIADYNPDANLAKADGIQLMVIVKDLPQFLEGLKKLNTPYETLNVIYPEKKVIIRYNTKGGLS